MTILTVKKKFHSSGLVGLRRKIYIPIIELKVILFKWTECWKMLQFPLENRSKFLSRAPNRQSVLHACTFKKKNQSSTTLHTMDLM